MRRQQYATGVKKVSVEEVQVLKTFNTTNLRNHLRHSHHELFDELLVKGREDTEKKAEEGKVANEES